MGDGNVEMTQVSEEVKLHYNIAQPDRVLQEMTPLPSSWGMARLLIEQR